ncbi:non-ribosomal peptide synthetase [Kaarinaea lacus]
MTTFNTLPDFLNAASTTNRGITFIESGDSESTVSYRDLLSRSLALLALLQQRSLSPGDEMIFLLKDNQAFVEMFWACILGGIVPVPLAPGISDEHRAKVYKIFNKLEKPHLYTDSATLERLSAYAEAQELNTDFEKIHSKTLLTDQTVNATGSGTPHSIQPNDTAFIQFSSGSTSEPKGVVLSHANLVANCLAILNGSATTEKDVVLSWMPLTHDMGLIGMHLGSVAATINHHLMPTELFSRRPLLWLQKSSDKKATITCSPNFGYKHYLKALGDKTLDNLELSQLRLIFNGAEPISLRLCDEFLTRMQTYGLKRESMFTVYGLAEASLAVTFPPPHTPYRHVCVNRHSLNMGGKVEYVESTSQNAAQFAIEGKAVANCHVRIADDNHQPLGDDTVGCIHIKGSNVTRGYYKDETSNATSFTEDGWLDTGDLGFLKDGELVVTGRSKEIIFAHGQNYYPHDIEAIALQSSQMELGKVAAYGVRESNAEEDELLIFIIFRGDLNDFLPLVRETNHLINEQTGLEVTHVIPVNRIPKTTSGKLQRRLLGDAYLNGEYREIIQQLDQLHDQQQRQIDGDLTAMEATLKAIVDAVVTDKHLGVHENFFDSGISSLALAEIHQRIEDTWPGAVDVTDLFEYQTIAEVAQFLETKVE